MNVLLDTCALLALAQGELPKGAAAALRSAPEASVSVVSAWEVAIKVASGKLRLSAPPIDWIQVTRQMLPDSEGAFALRVRGNSMIDALVNDGDTIILRQQSFARNGELVAVRLRKDPTNPVTTLKRFYRINGHVLLKPENPTFKQIRAKADEVEIQGKVLYVIRDIPGNDKKIRPK